MSFSLNSLYKEVGLSKQAVAQYGTRQKIFDSKTAQLVLEADELREDHPGCGVEKMYYTLKPNFMGRDRFIELMMELGYRLKRKKNYRRTTIASKIYYPNLIKGMKIDRPSMVWQSDITYIPIGDRHYYAVFIIDVYTKKIVGYKVSENMRAQANMDALKMALNENEAPLFHHSDRGSQYTYKEYISLLKDNGSQISMALNAQDNAFAERINRTIKEEYLNHWKPKDFGQLKRMTAKAVRNYNSKRLHNNNDRMSPERFIKQFSVLRHQERKLMTIFNNEN
ncbi:IS3 family transposase [Gelidibacter sp. F63206]|uniref:IS3 family transposase n=1 Tax=Gelidibacter sp. F63206 TaxID=2926425 RepID=UPI001FF519A8|nr:IS3 family transposase [Gelidibacter sp. F63206]MCK0114620.1 IS3 family transposase [Gelidibacter sp. F63206]MCK0114667.1 IS3 family transposase [Gelidibacter sp. F63206]MCK0114695.1 IS3 family transposase [Gelidibacter sp. F63206]MCK0114724.1 IS3 family transposase [Gelidibacter sp. F63206]MCK0115387.1 IS3 family transposase [Gelidibacter sp. F63206]